MYIYLAVVSVLVNGLTEAALRMKLSPMSPRQCVNVITSLTLPYC